MTFWKPGGRQLLSGERERRKTMCAISHELAQTAPASTIYFTKPQEVQSTKSFFSGVEPSEAAAPVAAKGSRAAPVDSELYEEAMECFRLFDKDGDGFVRVKEVATMLRSLGFVVYPDQVKTFEKDMWRKRITTINFLTFFAIVNKGFPKMVDPVEVLNAFHLLDRERKGSVNVKEVKHLFRTLGEKMSEEDWQKLMNVTFTAQDGATPVSMKSGTFIKMICGPAKGENEWRTQATNE